MLRFFFFGGPVVTWRGGFQMLPCDFVAGRGETRARAREPKGGPRAAAAPSASVQVHTIEGATLPHTSKHIIPKVRFRV